MKTKILTMLLEPSVYEAIRRAAYEAHCSMGEIARRAVAEYFGRQPRGRGKKEGPDTRGRADRGPAVAGRPMVLKDR